jgi:hypothetical protein
VGEVIDTTVRGLLYEAGGSSRPAGALAEGERIVSAAAGASAIPLAVLRADPADVPRWLEQAGAAVESLLAPTHTRPGSPPPTRYPEVNPP